MNDLSPRWTFITVSYNSSAAIRNHWSDIKLPQWVEWIVVDNASTDDSVDAARRLGAKCIALPKNLGFSAANNIGFNSSAGQYVAFLNPDVSPNIESLGAIEKFIDAHPRSLVAPQLLNSDGTLQPNGRGLPYLAHKVMHRLQPEALDGTYRMFAEDSATVKVDWLIGAVVMGLRQHLDSIGPWDSRFFVYYEDSDLGLRNALVGGDSFVLGNHRWEHGWARDTKGFRMRPWILEIRSMIRFYARYPRLAFPPSRKPAKMSFTPRDQTES